MSTITTFPQTWWFTDGLVSKIQVRLKGPETLLRSIPRERLVQAINLSGIKKGVTVVPLASEGAWAGVQGLLMLWIFSRRAFVVKADTLMERNVPCARLWIRP